MLWLKLKHISKRGHYSEANLFSAQIFGNYMFQSVSSNVDIPFSENIAGI